MTTELLAAGCRFHQAGDLPRAEQAYQQFLQRDPHNAQGWYLLGVLRQAQRKLPDALHYYQQALRLRPDFAEAHYALGMIRANEGNAVEAIASYQHALRLRPDQAEIYLQLGNLLKDQGRLQESLAVYRAALQVKPDCAEAYLGLGNALLDQDRRAEAIAAYRAALQRKPDAAHIHSNLVLVLQYDPGWDAQAILQEVRRWDQQYAQPLARFIPPHTNFPDPERRLRVGYVSSDFRYHVNSFFMDPLLAHHDRQQCEVFCYANVAQPDALTDRLRGHADVWRSTLGLSDDQAAELIRQDEIDILVDLGMHLIGNRLLIFARKPAPVQVTWLAYPGTTGLSAIDYRLTDPHFDPPGQFDADYSEESFRLADTFWCYDPLAGALPINAPPAVQNGHVTFGCVNNFCKINAGVLAIWAEILQTVSQSRLLLVAPRGEPREWVLAQLGRAGIAASRVEFADRLSRREYFEQFHRIDLALDPFPCNGGTTSLDGLWMGVPLVTLVGRTVVGRAGWSLLSNLGLQELAALTPEQYVRLAVELAGDLPRLRELRGTLRQRMERSPLMDAPRFARQVEQAYRQMWRRWCRIRAPQQETNAP